MGGRGAGPAREVWRKDGEPEKDNGIRKCVFLCALFIVSVVADNLQ